MSGLLILVAAALAYAVPQRSPFAREMLAAHNAARARVRVAPLVWSDRLAAAAQAWADHLLSRHQFSHQPNSPHGENLFEIQGAGATPDEVVGGWAAESANYDYRRNRCRGACGHYTQVVWRNTTQVGCAVARARDREIWDCQYDPPGNVIGQRPY